jgi:hypothetical protein
MLTLATASFSAQNSCTAQSGSTRAQVIELYTSEGCSSCPPADKWLSSLKTPGADKAVLNGAVNEAGNQASNVTSNAAVVQAFHVGYWDYIGWVDRFASPAHTTRQRQLAALGGQSTIYTPQAVLNGRDWRDWYGSGARLPAGKELAGASISLRQVGDDQFEATVTPTAGAASNGSNGSTGSTKPTGPTWSAYWTVTEHGHSSKVKSGENAGEFLQHDFVVRQYTPVGDYPVDAKAPQKLVWRSIAATPGHARQINLVVFDPKTGKTLQALSVGC